MDRGRPAPDVEAIDRLRATARANPRSTTFVALAHALSDAGRAAEAEEVARAGLAEHPELATGQVALGRAMLERGRLREAQAILLDTVKSNPHHGDGFRWLGEVLLRRGDPERARGILEHALEISPSDERARALLIEAGGTALEAGPRPTSDFESTRIADAGSLARHMGDEFDWQREIDELRRNPDMSPRLRAEDATVIRPVEDLLASSAASTRVVPVPTAPRPGRIQTPELTPVVVPDRDLRSDNAPTPMVETLSVADELVGLAGAREGRAASSASDAASGLLLPAAPPVPSGAARGGPPGVASDEADAVRAPAAPRGRRYTPSVATVPRFGTAGPRRAARRRVAVVLGLGLLGLGGGAVAWVLRGHARIDAQHRGMIDDLSDGSLRPLLHARETGIRLLQAEPGDAAAAAALALASAFLARDYALATDGEAEQSASRAAAAGASSARDPLIEAARVLVATGGDLKAAEDRATRAAARLPGSVWTRLALGRVRALAGDAVRASSELDAALAAAPEAPVAVTCWAQQRLDTGDAAAAAPALRSLLLRNPRHGRARLLLAEAERAVGASATGGDVKALAAMCAEDGTISPAVAGACALGAAADARLVGERIAAAARVRTAAGASPAEPRVLAQTAVAFANLGYTEAAADIADRAARYATEGYPPLAWARAAVAIGQGGRPVLPPGLRPAGPESRLVALRLEVDPAVSGARRSAVLEGLPAAVLTADQDLATLATLFKSGGKLASTGPVAAFVRGVQGADPTAAMAAFADALDGHGDACRAAQGYLRLATEKLGRDTTADPLLQAFKARHPQCPLLASAAARP